MGKQNYFFKISYLIKLIEDSKTGTAEDLAQKLDVSRRTVFRYLDELRDSGANISFSKSKNTYLFENKFDFINDFIKNAI